MEKTQIVLDLSKWNIVNDYSLFVDGVSGIILRLGYRSCKDAIIKEDPKFKTHFKGIKNTKTPIGIYFFTNAITAAEAREEADWVANYLYKNNISLCFPIAIDTEYGNNTKTGRADKLSKDVRTECVIVFCERMKEQGYQPMIYASDSWFVSQLDYDKVKQYPKWVARYSDERPEKTTDNVVGWQKTDKYDCKGIKTQVDMSEWYGPIKEQSSRITASEVAMVRKQQEEKAKSNVSIIVAGNIVTLKNEPLYKTSTTDVVAKNISGTYYYWDDQIKEGKIRITTKKEYVRVMGKVTGWITVK